MIAFVKGTAIGALTAMPIVWGLDSIGVPNMPVVAPLIGIAAGWISTAHFMNRAISRKARDR